jgi:hypothetical protein
VVRDNTGYHGRDAKAGSVMRNIFRTVPFAVALLIAACAADVPPAGSTRAAPTRYPYLPSYFPTTIGLPPVSDARLLGPVAAPVAGLVGQGSIIWYRPGAARSACGARFADTDLVAAVPASLWTAADRTADPLCGRALTGIDVLGNRTVTVHVEDRCPSCAADRIELSLAAFARLADPAVGAIPASWRG